MVSVEPDVSDIPEDVKAEVVRIMKGPPSLHNFHLACIAVMTTKEREICMESDNDHMNVVLIAWDYAPGGGSAASKVAKIYFEHVIKINKKILQFDTPVVKGHRRYIRRKSEYGSTLNSLCLFPPPFRGRRRC